MVVVAAIKCTTKPGQRWAKMAETHQKLDRKIRENTCVCKDLTNFEFKAELM